MDKDLNKNNADGTSTSENLGKEPVAPSQSKPKEPEQTSPKSEPSSMYKVYQTKEEYTNDINEKISNINKKSKEIEEKFSASEKEKEELTRILKLKAIEEKGYNSKNFFGDKHSLLEDIKIKKTEKGEYLIDGIEELAVQNGFIKKSVVPEQAYSGSKPQEKPKEDILDIVLKKRIGSR